MCLNIYVSHKIIISSRQLTWLGPNGVVHIERNKERQRMGDSQASWCFPGSIFPHWPLGKCINFPNNPQFLPYFASALLKCMYYWEFFIVIYVFLSYLTLHSEELKKERKKNYRENSSISVLHCLFQISKTHDTICSSVL